MRRLAYADPPYPGQAAARYGGTEVDHAVLVERLRTYDGWVSTTCIPDPAASDAPRTRYS